MTRIGTDLLNFCDHRGIQKLNLSPCIKNANSALTRPYVQYHNMATTQRPHHHNMATTQRPHHERPPGSNSKYTNLFHDPKVFIFHGYQDLVYGIEGSRLVSSTSCFTEYHR